MLAWRQVRQPIEWEDCIPVGRHVWCCKSRDRVGSVCCDLVVMVSAGTALDRRALQVRVKGRMAWRVEQRRIPCKPSRALMAQRLLPARKLWLCKSAV